MTLEELNKLKITNISQLKKHVFQFGIFEGGERITQRFNDKDGLKYVGRLGHDGVDMIPAVGGKNTVFAYEEGEVLYAGWDTKLLWGSKNYYRGYGIMTIVWNKENKRIWIYGHLSNNKGIEVGQYIKKGEKVGVMGGSGFGIFSYFARHLHLGAMSVNELGAVINRDNGFWGALDLTNILKENNTISQEQEEMAILTEKKEIFYNTLINQGARFMGEDRKRVYADALKADNFAYIANEQIGAWTEIERLTGVVNNMQSSINSIQAQVNNLTNNLNGKIQENTELKNKIARDQMSKETTIGNVTYKNENSIVTQAQVQNADINQKMDSIKPVKHLDMSSNKFESVINKLEEEKPAKGVLESSKVSKRKFAFNIMKYIAKHPASSIIVTVLFFGIERTTNTFPDIEANEILPLVFQFIIDLISQINLF